MDASPTRDPALEGALEDGTPVRFRLIAPDDKNRLAQGFARLSEGSRYRRFFRHIDHLTDEQLVYLTEVDFTDHFAWVAELPDEPGRPGIGVSRWIRLAAEPEIAEAAVTVIDDYQNRGVGTTLLWLTSRSARERGIRAFRIWVQGDNSPVLALLRDFNIVPRQWQSGIAQIDVPLPEDLDAEEILPAKSILRATARGELVARADAAEGTGTHFVNVRPHERP